MVWLLQWVQYFYVLVLLEKDEGSLEARVTTPLRPTEYLGSKVLTLTGLAVLESSLITIASVGLQANWVWLLASVVETAVFFCLVGFIVVARYDSVNEYLLPSVGYLLLLGLPLAAYMADWSHWLLYLHPMQATLTLMTGAWQALPWWLISYCLVYPALWIALAAHLSLRTFHRFVITKQGVK